VRFGLAIFVVVLLASSIASFTIADANGDVDPVAIDEPGSLPTPVEGTPNVYWLLLDGYARPDVLERVVGFDDSPFVQELGRRGFEVSSSSLASYPRTHLSVSATLQMDYVIEPGDPSAGEFERFGPVVIGRSNTTARFRAHGYSIAYGPAGGVEWSACRRDLVDVCLDPHRPAPSTGELEQTLLDLTPLGALPLPVPYADPGGMVDQVLDPATGLQEPFFVFQHLLTPHDPYRYDEDCAPRSVPTNRHALSGPEQVHAYRTQVRCINELVLDAVDRIIDADPDAVIIVQSDHGSDFTFSWKADPADWTDDQLVERYGAFDAMRLPAGCDAQVEGVALVNTFRVVFGCIEGHPPQLLPYRLFLQPLDDLSAITEADPKRVRG
jgi:hypothetical protein